jgi:Uma2 family endonuclease
MATYNMATVCSPTEYLYLAQADPWKNEYYAGQMHPLPPISLNESRISSNLVMALRQQLRKRGFEVFASRMRLHVPAADSYFFPDVLGYHAAAREAAAAADSGCGNAGYLQRAEFGGTGGGSFGRIRAV